MLFYNLNPNFLPIFVQVRIISRLKSNFPGLRGKLVILKLQLNTIVGEAKEASKHLLRNFHQKVFPKSKIFQGPKFSKVQNFSKNPIINTIH